MLPQKNTLGGGFKLWRGANKRGVRECAYAQGGGPCSSAGAGSEKFAEEEHTWSIHSVVRLVQIGTVKSSIRNVSIGRRRV